MQHAMDVSNCDNSIVMDGRITIDILYISSKRRQFSVGMVSGTVAIHSASDCADDINYTSGFAILCGQNTKKP